MKRVITLITVSLLLLSSLFVCAVTNEYTLTVPKGFTVWQSGENMEEISLIFGISEEELKKQCNEKNIVYAAANHDNSKQVTLSITENEFSNTAVSFSRLSNKDLKEIANDFNDSKRAKIEIVTSKDSNRYIKITEELYDSGGQYTLTEYITVCSEKLYTLCITETTSEKQTTLADSVFNNYKIKDNAKPITSGNNMLYTLLAVGGIAIFTAVAAVLLYTVIRDIKRNRETVKEKDDAN